MGKRLPLVKLEKFKQLLRMYKKVTIVELQSLISLLNCTCSVVTHGLPFVRRVIHLTLGLKHPNHKRRLNKKKLRLI